MLTREPGMSIAAVCRQIRNDGEHTLGCGGARLAIHSGACGVGADACVVVARSEFSARARKTAPGAGALPNLYRRSATFARPRPVPHSNRPGPQNDANC